MAGEREAQEETNPESRSTPGPAGHEDGRQSEHTGREQTVGGAVMKPAGLAGQDARNEIKIRGIGREDQRSENDEVRATRRRGVAHELEKHEAGEAVKNR